MKQRGFWRVSKGFSFVSVAGNGNPLAGKLQHQQKKGTTPRLLHVRWFVHPDLFLLAPKYFTQKFPPRLKNIVVFPGWQPTHRASPPSSLKVLFFMPIRWGVVRCDPASAGVRPQTGTRRLASPTNGCGALVNGNIPRRKWGSYRKFNILVLLLLEELWLTTWHM